jgi:CSLREA domain-containing protein
MNKNFTLPRYLQMLTVILILAFTGFFAATPSSAIGEASTPHPIDPTAPIRQDMIDIAERYLTYRWQAINDHAFDSKNPDPPDYLRNDKHDSFYDPDHPKHVETPDRAWCDEHDPNHLEAWRCWDFAPIVNIGVPYFWGEGTAVEDDATHHLHLDKNTGYGEADSKYFNEKKEAGRPVGDITHDTTGLAMVGVGVDCAGLVSQAWRMGVYSPGYPLQENSRPMRFKDLQAGDIILNATNHVVLFWKFIDYDPASSSEPVAGEDNGTTFWAYEASEYAGKVVLSKYRLIQSNPVFRSAPSPQAYFHGMPYDTDNVTIKRIQSCFPDPENPDNWDSSNPTNCHALVQSLADFYPRTDFTPIDVELVLDISGSIDGLGLAQAKYNAKQIIGTFLRPGDKVGIATFAETAKPPLQTLTTIVDAGSVAALNQEIDSIVAGGNTSIASGLMAGGTDLMTLGQDETGAPDPVRVMLLLSDGEENTDPSVFSISSMPRGTGLLDVIHGEGISIYTLQVGGASQPNFLLKNIAAKTDGLFSQSIGEVIDNLRTRFFGSPINGSGAGAVGSTGSQATSQQFALNSEGSAGQSVPATEQPNQATPEGTVEQPALGLKEAAGQPLPANSSGIAGQSALAGPIGITEQPVLVDSSMGAITASVFWSGNPLDVTLVRADGTIIDPSTADVDRNVSFVSGETYASYTVHAPEPGQWQLRISGEAGQAYESSVTTNTAMIVSASIDKKEYSSGEPIKFTASVEDDVSPFSASPEYIHGATMQVVYEDPRHVQSTFALYDDGLHEDGAANDGVYGGIFPNTLLEGIYNFNVQISGVNNRAGEPFAREVHLSANVNTPPSVVSIVRASPNPTHLYAVKFTVTFSEPVVGVDISDFALTTGDMSGAAISAVSGSGNTYTVTVNTGNDNGTLRLDVVDDDTIRDGIDPSIYGVNGFGGQALGGDGLGNGDFTNGQSYDVEHLTGEMIVNKLADTNDGLCDTDCSLREAISNAVPGSVITFAPSLSGGTIHLASDLAIDRGMIIDGSALAIPITVSGDTDNDGAADVSVFNVNSGVTATLKSLVVSKGAFGGVSNSGTLTITNSTFSNNGALNLSPSIVGGGVSNSGILTITNSTFLNNVAEFGGGVSNDGGAVTIMNSTFLTNTATYSGGGASNSPGISGNGGTLMITNSTFVNNAAAYGGGVVNYGNSTLTMTNSTFSGNHAASGTGGIENNGRLNYANTIITNSTSGGDCVNYSAIGTNTNNLVEDGSCSALLSGDPNLGPLANNGGLLSVS